MGSRVKCALHVVHRHVGLAAKIAAARLGWMVGGDIPAAHREVDSSAIRDLVVDDDELLVMRGTEGKVAVEQYLGAIGHSRPEDPPREQLAIDGIEHRMVPQENPDLELRPALEQPTQQPADRDWSAVRGLAAALEPHAAVQLPAEYEDRPLRREQRGAQRLKVVRSIHEHGCTRGVLEPPACVTFDQSPAGRAVAGAARLRRGATPR
jgi:hypothetical protein